MAFPRIGYEISSVGVYTRIYYAVREPKKVYMIDKFSLSISAAGAVSNEGQLGTLIEEDHGWTSSLEGSELSISIEKFAGVSRTNISVAYFIKGQQYFSLTHRPMLWGFMTDNIAFTKQVEVVPLNQIVPQFPIKEPRKGIHVWEAIFS